MGARKGELMTTSMAVGYLVIWTFLLVHSVMIMAAVGCQRCSAQKVQSLDTLKEAVSECRVSRRALILVNSTMISLFGTAAMVMAYYFIPVSQDVSRYELIVCFYCLVAVVSWFIGMDCIRYHRRSKYERIDDADDSRSGVTGVGGHQVSGNMEMDGGRK